MKNLLLSITTLLIFSVALTACGGGAGGSDAGGGGTSDDGGVAVDPFVAHDNFDTFGLGDDIVAKESSGTLTTSGDLTTDITNQIFTLQGLAVVRNDSTAYLRENDETSWLKGVDVNKDELQIDRSVLLSRITAPTVTLTFESGAIASVTAYVNAKYDTDINHVRVINHDRVTIFGFTDSMSDPIASNYMAYISWSADNLFNSEITDDDQTLYDIDGAMIAGVETTDFLNISADGVMFTGKGYGTYGNVGDTPVDGYGTVFDVVATVNFGANKSVVIESSNTACAISNCTDSNLSELDFITGPIIYTANNISGAIALKGDSEFKGNLDARFYGADAWEFGGTFALANASDKGYYFGAFGAERVAVSKFGIICGSFWYSC